MDINHNNFTKKSMQELNRLSIEEAQKDSKFPIVLVLDNVRSMHNVGSVFRTADSFGIAKIMLCGVTPCPPHREIHKTALGATETVHWQYYPTVDEALNELKQNDYKIAALEQVHNSISLETFDEIPEHKIALIFGNEVEGVSDEALEQCDYALEIPQFGSKHSLNISVTAGIATWELIRKYSK